MRKNPLAEALMAEDAWSALEPQAKLQHLLRSAKRMASVAHVGLPVKGVEKEDKFFIWMEFSIHPRTEAVKATGLFLNTAYLPDTPLNEWLLNIAHFVAHAAVPNEQERRGHGSLWQSIVVELGGSPDISGEIPLCIPLPVK